MAALAGTVVTVSCAASVKATCRQQAVRSQARISRSAFLGTCSALKAQARSEPRRINTLVRAFEDEEENENGGYIRQWPNPQFLKEVEEEFPEKGVADVEEARCLFSSLGYTYLDVRPALEYEDAGRVKGSVNIPVVTSTKVVDPKTRQKSFKKEPNEKFVQMVEKRFPDKEKAKLLIGCSNGKQYSMDALMALDEAGYQNIVGLRGGYYAWFRVFDNKLGRRFFGEYAETFRHDGDSCGIHASGAGFDRVDSADRWVPPTY